MSGGDIAHRGELHHGEILTIDLYDPESVTFSDQPRDFQYRFGAPSGFGCYVSVRRQSSYFPWKWKTRTYVWDFVTRYSDGAPKVYEGKQEVSFRESIADPRLNPNDERYDPPAMATPTVASDESYDQLTADAKSGINIVGFVGTWQQGELFRNFTNALNAFAAKHPGIQVLVIHPDTAPALSKRFDTDALPAYIAIQDGEEVESRTGLLSCSDLESYFHKSIEVASKKREGR